MIIDDRIATAEKYGILEDGVLDDNIFPGSTDSERNQLAYIEFTLNYEYAHPNILQLFGGIDISFFKGQDGAVKRYKFA